MLSRLRNFVFEQGWATSLKLLPVPPLTGVFKYPCKYPEAPLNSKVYVSLFIRKNHPNSILATEVFQSFKDAHQYLDCQTSDIENVKTGVSKRDHEYVFHECDKYIAVIYENGVIQFRA